MCFPVIYICFPGELNSNLHVYSAIPQLATVKLMLRKSPAEDMFRVWENTAVQSSTVQ